MPDPADPLAARSEVLFRAFGLYLRWYFWRHFQAVRLSRAGLPRIPEGRPVIIVTNHPSWWDPALFILLTNSLLRDRIGFGPMDARMLGQYGVLRRMGVFGIDLASARGAAQFLAASLRILSEPRAALWITAEGHFTDPRTRPVRLRPGIAHLARRVPAAVLVPFALEYTFWNERKPEALGRFGPPIEAGRHRDVAGWTATLEAALTCEMDALAAESAARDRALFVPILRSAGGVGGVYDLWRRGRAMVQGRPVRLAHEEEAEKAS
jgi:1-acyl-sn-glycerol-3-phosphate acyltransferase